MILTHTPPVPVPPHRVPICRTADREVELPLFTSVRAGFPSPALDHTEEPLNLHDYLVKNPASTFFVRVEGESMIEAGIYPDDILVVDRSIEARHDDVVVAYINSDFTVKRLSGRRGGRIVLRSENAHFAPITIDEGDELIIWGVVTTVLHKPVRR